MNKESYSYYKNSYRANKRYREKVAAKYTIEDMKREASYGQMLTKSEFEDMRSSGLSTKEIVYNQFHFYTKENAKKIQKSILQEGLKVSLTDIQQRNFSKEVYDKMDALYHELRDGMSSREAASLISYAFYGS